MVLLINPQNINPYLNSNLYMAITLTLTQIMTALGMLGIIFGIYRYFRDPQVNSEKTEALIVQKDALTGIDYDRRFSQMQQNITDSMTLAQNHIHTIDVKVDALQSIINQMGKDVTRLSTIIDERIPKK